MVYLLRVRGGRVVLLREFVDGHLGSGHYRFLFEAPSACFILRPLNLSGEMSFPIAGLVGDQINLAVVIPCYI